MQGTDPEDVIKNAFGCFDENNTGHLNEELLRELLTTMGDRFTDDDVSSAYAQSLLTLANLMDNSSTSCLQIFPVNIYANIYAGNLKLENVINIMGQWPILYWPYMAH